MTQADESPWAPHALALRDYFAGDRSAAVRLTSTLGEDEVLPASVWFRTSEAFFPLDHDALGLSRGRVLDVGAGTGVHALALQERGLDVVAIDHLPEAVEIMRRRGVRDARVADLFAFARTHAGDRFDTVLVVCNGAGLARTLAGLAELFAALERLVAPQGQVLIDSTDVRPAPPEKPGGYGGEIEFRLEYQGVQAPPFLQLYVDPDAFGERARAAGWSFEVVATYDGGGYLARLTR